MTLRATSITSGRKITKYTWVIAKATADKVLLDETTDLVDGVTSQVYESTGWAAAGAHSVLSAVYPDTEEKEKSVDFKIQQLSNAYKYGFAVSGLDAYSGISTMVRGDGKSTLVFQIEGAWGYASYSVGVLNSNWHAITIPFADNGWKVNGGAQSLNDFALSQDFLGAGYALYGVTSFDIVWKTIGDSGYAFTDVYMKNAVLASDWTLANKDTASYSLGTTYTSLVNKVDLKLVQGENNVFTLSSLNLKANLNAALTLSKDGENLTFKTADDGASLTYVGKVDDKGRKIAFVSASGTYGAYLQQADFNIVTTIDDFESYTATGTGYDGNNTDLSKVSGLRAAYYGEYYTGSGSGTSALGDKNWQMMGSTDYANLVTTSAHGGNNSVSFKRSTNAMRFTTSGMALKTALPWAKADTFSFWAKGVSADVTLKVQMFDSANALYWLTPTTFTIPANSDWTQYTVALTATKSYYGFGFLFANASPVVYPQIDDIQLFTSGNPWATYVDSSVVPAGTIMTGSTTALKSVTATFGSDSTLTVAAIDAADATHNLTGTYSVDASNVITIDCGTDLNYVGVLSNDKTAIKYTSATGTLATYVASLFLEATVTGKTRVAGYENTTSSALQTLYTVEETDSFTAVTDKTSYIQEDETVLDSGFASAKLKADVTSGNYNGKYRYRFAVAASYGSVSNIAIRLKNAGSYAITGGVFYVNTASDSTKRTNAGVSFTIAAGAGWTTYTGTFTAHDVYGFSIYFSSVGTSLAAATGSLYIDNVFVW
jgi:hypothetical protein